MKIFYLVFVVSGGAFTDGSDKFNFFITVEGPRVPSGCLVATERLGSELVIDLDN